MTKERTRSKMAEKRMFTKRITDDERFYTLPSSTQLLYFHLSMSADDDGFNNQVSLAMFKAHASIADLEALLDRRFLYQFETGVIVIKHWRMANALRKDRYTQTTFKKELAQLKLDENGAYTRVVATNWQPTGNQLATQDRLDKDSICTSHPNMYPIEKESLKDVRTLSGLSPDINEIVEYLNAKCGTKYKASTPNTRKFIQARLNEGFKVDDFKKVIDKMFAAWHSDARMSQYLRPQTLFGTKFESYLNRHESDDPTQDYLDKWRDA